eukprot:TRINITY_DN2976_c0_g1_i1.p2 TRINITY_DN2976_c0_g1~~TRINITY_DN2976_c0_g1_i1.p2  ORF type:complete len:184 (+),score=37.69 TRINITY_DN2976_c0_g1_i1:1065-1616(+)
MFNLANVSVDGVNFHGVSPYWFYSTFHHPAYYDAITYNNSTMVPVVHPLYYAILAMAQTIRTGSDLIGVNITESTNELIKVWAVFNDATQTVRVVVIHKDLNSTQPANITINVSGSDDSSVAKVTRLVAPSPYSQFNVTLAGQTFDGSEDGTPVGSYAYETVSGSNGMYSFAVQPLTVAFFEL